MARDLTEPTNSAGTVFFSTADRSNLTGVVGGGQFGYNWQVQNGVWRLEANIQGSGEKGTRNFICPIGVCTPAIVGALPIPGPAVPVSLTEKLLWFGTVRGRVGVLATPAALFYATGGLAYGEVASNISVGPLNSFSPNKTKVGYSVGAGVEGMFARNWTARLEYLYVDLGSVSGSLATALPALGGGTLVSTYSSRVTDNILRLGVNYKFGGPGIGAY
ncbi:outer membrane beta-barrel protein [Rhodovastum sp. RN2-1]|uniref:Outer membrane beta-barrel protein n=1 Tax=Limobrevibacterium gyesilva TaxID=2991712 RepID=A0AA41YSC4_9PROT|nr:outer membrane beta-barrel protein [Limobrevibacterium gyesilva]